jgi:hypothetical protein
LGATPPRDGPFKYGASDVAVQKPPKTRVKRGAHATIGRPFGPAKR